MDAWAVVVEPDGDAELAQPLHEREVLGMQGLLDLLELPVGGRSVERAGLAVADRDEQADLAQPGSEVVGVVRGPQVAVAPRVAPEGVWVLVEVAQQVLDHPRTRERVALVAGVQQPAVGGGRPEHARVARRISHRPKPAHGQPGDHAAVPGPPVALQQLPQLGQVEGLPA